MAAVDLALGGVGCGGCVCVIEWGYFEFGFEWDRDGFCGIGVIFDWKMGFVGRVKSVCEGGENGVSVCIFGWEAE